MIIFVRVEVPEHLLQPGIAIAQILREVTPHIELANPLDDGVYIEPHTGLAKAEWTISYPATMADLIRKR